MAGKKIAKNITRDVTSDNKNFPICDNERLQRIAERAYFKAQARNFEGGSPEQDWLEAEIEIDQEIHYVR